MNLDPPLRVSVKKKAEKFSLLTLITNKINLDVGSAENTRSLGCCHHLSAPGPFRMFTMRLIES